MGNNAKLTTKKHQAIDISGKISEYDITKDIIFNKFANTKLPDHLDEPQSGIAKHTGVFAKEEAQHLLNRTLFGHDKALLDTTKSKTLDQAVNDLLNTNPAITNFPVYWNERDPNYGATWHDKPYDPNLDNMQSSSLIYWLSGNMIFHDNTILEKMVFFWHNHFATENDVVGTGIDHFNHFKLLRDNAMGNFKDFVYKITIDPAMLKYLNGIYNTKNAPDENYARELMELFTLGKDPASQYTENDVKAAARILTGWKINATSRQSNFVPNAHDVLNKQFSSFFGNSSITGKSGASGANETQELINLIFTKSDIIAQFMVRKLYRYFVYYNITADIETNVIIPLANDFKTNWEIKPLLENLFKSAHFYDSLNRGCYIKTPFDLYGSINKACKTIHPVSTVFRTYKSYELAYFFGTTMSLQMAEPPSVAGWPAFYQTPKFHEIWINSDTFPKRVSYCVYLLFSGYPVQTEKVIIDCISLAEQFGNDAADPNKLVAGICDLMLGADISITSKNTIKNGSLLTGVSLDSYWTSAWNDFQADKTNTIKKNTVNIRIQLLLKFIFELPEFQLM